MNPPQNINNHFYPNAKAEDQPVSPFCCCYYNFTEQSFYKFINIWDLVFVTLSLLSFNYIQLIIKTIYLIIVIIALVKFCGNGKYNTGIHKAYAIIRLIFVFLQVILTLVIAILYILALSHPGLTQHQHNALIINAAISLGIVFPIFLVSIQWSFLLKKVVNSQIDSLTQPMQPGVQQNNQYPQPGMNAGFNPADSQYVN